MSKNEYKFISSALRKAKRWHTQRLAEIQAKLINLTEPTKPVVTGRETCRTLALRP